eukprot:5510285-Amphidinium_carterae.1
MLNNAQSECEGAGFSGDMCSGIIIQATSWVMTQQVPLLSARCFSRSYPHTWTKRLGLRSAVGFGETSCSHHSYRLRAFAVNCL